jgi:hypothetical protein
MRSVVVVLLLCVVVSSSVHATELRTRNLVLVTLDGVRTQEIFSGMDPIVADRSAEQVYSEIATGRTRYWAETPQQRRKLLMPFFWGTLVPSGMLFGDPSADSEMLVRNAFKFSSPGYAEMLTGQAQPEVDDNVALRFPATTVLEYVTSTLQLPAAKVAQIGSWDVFEFLAASKDDVFLMNGGFNAFPAEFSTPEIDRLVELRRDVMQLWEESSNDSLTYYIAKEYLTQYEPRLLWLGMSQSDDWAHADRYDRLLDYLHLTDQLLQDLWSTLQANPAYRGNTTLIITTDHGRGLGPVDWAEHDETIPGSEDIWLAIIGPDTPPLGTNVPPGIVYQADVAATIVKLFGLDPADFNANAGPVLPGVISAEQQ